MRLKKALLLLIILVTCFAVYSQEFPHPASEEYQIMKKRGLFNKPEPAKVQSDYPSIPEPTDGGMLVPLDGTFTMALGPNDDDYTNEIFLPFNFQFYGNTLSSFYINNNGNISFWDSYSNYSTTGFPVDNFPMLAPFWADVDTRGQGSGYVYYKIESNRATVYYDHVGYYNEHDDKLNTFEVIFTDGLDPLIGIGNNVAFCYGDMQWTSGDLGGGSGGFGGLPATVGANKGDGVNYFLIGRFDHEGTDYDGPGGNNDGVSYLDNNCFAFFTGGLFDNVPPVPVGFPAFQPMGVLFNSTFNLSVSFLSPEVGQSTNTVVNVPGSLNGFNYTVTSGNVCNIDMDFFAGVDNLGLHEIEFIATDDGIPPKSTTTYLSLLVSGDLELQVDPVSLSESLCINSQSSQTLTLKNTGAGDVDFTLSTPNPWLSISPNSGTVAPGNNIDIQVDFNTSALASGNYNGEIQVHSNVPSLPIITVPVDLEVLAPMMFLLSAEIEQHSCPGSEIILEGWQNGIDYYIYHYEPSGNVIVDGPVQGNVGEPTLTFGQYWVEGLYKVLAVDPLSNCEAWMNDSTTIVPAPQVSNLLPTGWGCQEVEITLENSEPGAMYRLLRDINDGNGPTFTGIEVPGTGNVISFGTQSENGIYTTTAYFEYLNGVQCWADMDGSYEISNSPVSYILDPSQGIFCACQDITLDGSEQGVNYFLMNTTTGNIFPDPIIGIQGTGAPITWLNVCESGDYVAYGVSEQNDECITNMLGEFTISTSPQIFELLSDPSPATYCIGENGVTLRLASSENSAVQYQLFQIQATPPDLPNGPPTLGTGATLEWTNITAGEYYLVAQYINDLTCPATMQDTILVEEIPLPVVNAGDDGTICFDDTYTVPNVVIANVSAFEWTVDLGYGELDDSTRIDPTYFPDAQDAGTSVRLLLTADGATSCNYTSATSTVNIEVVAMPSVDAGPGATVCVSDPGGIEITGSALDHGSLLWELDLQTGNGELIDADTETPTYIPHPLDAGKDVKVRIIANGMDECINYTVIDSCYVKVGAQPVVWIQQINNFQDSAYCSGQPAYFEDISDFGSFDAHEDQAIVSRVWDFGDGSQRIDTDDQVIAAHIYSIPGEYMVELIITAMIDGFESCSDSAEFDIIIHAPPFAGFDFNQKDYCGGLMQFEDTSICLESTPREWWWTFGDVGHSDQQNPQFEFESSGSQIIELMVTDNNGCDNSVTKTIYIEDFFDFEIKFKDTCFGIPINFEVDPLSLSPLGNGIETYEWSFGDATDPVTDPNPIHLYEEPGSYSVLLTATDSSGCTLVKEVFVNVPEPIRPDFTFTECNKFITFTNLTPYTDVAFSRWIWSFGDMEPANEVLGPDPLDVDHAYTANGTFMVSLSVFDINGCTGTFTVDSVKTLCMEDKGLFIPNALAPDDTNPEVATFMPKGIGLQDYQIRVYDLWGNLMWESSYLDENGSPTESWNGKYRNEDLPPGSYPYNAYGKYLDGTIWGDASAPEDSGLNPTGTILLIR